MLGFFRRIRKINDIDKNLTEAQNQLRELKKAINDSNKLLNEVKAEFSKIREQSNMIDKVRSYQRDLMYWEMYRNPGEDLKETKIRFFRNLPKAQGYERKLQKVFFELLVVIHNTCVDNNIPYWLDFGTLLGALRHRGFIPWDDDIDLGMMRADAAKLKEILSHNKDVVVNHRFLNTRGAGVHRSLQVRWANTEKGPFLPALDIFLYDYCGEKSLQKWDFMLDLKRKLTRESKKIPLYNHEKADYSNENYVKLGDLFEDYWHKIKEELKITDEENKYIVWGFDNIIPYSIKRAHFFSYDMMFPLGNISYEGKYFYCPNNYEEYIDGVYEDIFSLPFEILSHKHHSLNEKNKEKIDILLDMYSDRKDS